jgi:cellulose biosynthesis protein BcsQ
MSALKYDPNCSGSKAYVSLAKEVIKKTMET